MAAVFVAAIPSPEQFGTDTIARAAAEPVSPVTARVDATADDIVWCHRVAWALTEPIRSPVFAYIRLTAQFQRWDMFSNPSRVHPYVRMGYRLHMENGTIRTEYEQVFPSGPTGVWKFGSAYFASFMDKAMASVVENYMTLGKRAQEAGEPVPTDDMIRILLPYTRYFGHRRVTAGLPPGAQLIAAEFWRGSAPAPLPPPLAGQHIVERPAGQPPAINWERWAVDEGQ
jgi:hypothetical protein